MDSIDIYHGRLPVSRLFDQDFPQFFRVFLCIFGVEDQLHWGRQFRPQEAMWLARVAHETDRYYNLALICGSIIGGGVLGSPKTSPPFPSIKKALTKDPFNSIISAFLSI